MNATVSEKRNRVYPRKFDWDEARRLRAEGWTWKALSDHFGVSYNALKRVVHPHVNEAMTAYNLAYQKRGVCPDCGVKTSWNQPLGEPSRCRPCWSKRRRKITDTEAWCPSCEQWLPHSDFAPCHIRTEPPFRSGRECRRCQTKARQDYRERHREADREYAREYKRRRRAEGKT